MYTKFLHILLYIIAAGCLFVSCSSSDSRDDGDVSDAELLFTASGVSRSSVSTDLNYAGSTFVIFGDRKYSGSTTSECKVVFNGVPVTFNNSTWAYADTQYWLPSHEYSFVAVHPSTPAGVTDMVYSQNSLKVNFTLPEAFSDTPDMVVATHRRVLADQNSATYVPVSLRFAHIMSKINFFLTNDHAAETVRVTKIELEGVNQSGTFSLVPAPLFEGSRQTDDYDCSWSDFSDKKTLAAEIEVEVPDSEETQLFPDSNALFVVPQPDNTSIYVKMHYTLIYRNGRSENRTLTTTTPTGGWQQGKVYDYFIVLSPEINEIEFKVSVSDWKPEPNEDVQVPRK